ncbi:MAG TPA: ABC transporter ATP-binding protein [Solirubrobacteraceae bacterium]|jgi:putative spermidine/putrescine transport system ATP-binding protein|nr:ABC transporter ATP-binding protein [Solirubrobacteraceae bacterium]
MSAPERPNDATSGDGTGTAVPAVDVAGVRKTYGGVEAVGGVDLQIHRGEFFTMLGPSGSGKTTLLRIIAGFVAADAGHVRLNGVDVTREPPFARNVNTVFQDYALFPHMSVQQNVEYGLRVKRIPRPERRRRAQDALEMVRLPDHGARKPAQLSGGQRQRVALARAIANEPDVLLLDEPLGALDLKLRQEMQLELKRIQREVGITFIFVTHDQEEALTMSDRLAVMNNGRIEQLGTPVDVYEHPANEFVAGFIGVSNLLQRDGRRFTIRPEKVRLTDPGAPVAAGSHSEPGAVADVIYLGAVTRYVVTLDSGETLIAVRQNADTAQDADLLSLGARVDATWLESQTFTIGEEHQT